MIDFSNFERGFFDSKELFYPYHHTQIWTNGKLVYDSDKKRQSKKPNNNVPKNIKGDYDLSIHGNKIVLVDNKDGTTVEAKCHPDDEFDIGTGIKEAFKKLNEKREEIRKAKEEEEKKIKVGDWVEVVIPGDSYPNYFRWLFGRVSFDDIRNFEHTNVPDKGTIGRVIAIDAHSPDFPYTLVAIRTRKNGVYIVGIDGLRKVKKSV